jgi:HAE1 family hydrophobic/amphiphilic exporter-1
VQPDQKPARLAFIATRPVAITMVIVALTVFGLVSLAKLPMNLLPEISYPTLTVRTAFPGAAPEDVEDRISIRISEAVSTLPGLVRASSMSRAGFSDVLVELDWGSDMTLAVQEVRDRLDNVHLPQEAERPLILRYDPNLDPILRISISPAGQVAPGEELNTLTTLRWLAEKRIKRELEGLSGVAAIGVRGGLREEILVAVDPGALTAQGLDPAAIAQRLAAENLNASSGEVLEGSTRYLVRTLNEFQTVDEIRNLALVRKGGATVRIGDVAQVERTHAEREVIMRIDGNEAVELAIYREAGANIVEVAQRLREAILGTPEQIALAAKFSGPNAREPRWDERQKLSQIAWHMRADANFAVLSDQSTFIAAAVKDVRDSALLGALLSVLVIWIFLRRVVPTLVIALAIPISVATTFAPMFLLDVSLNIMSLGGLALGVGMLVDNAIVVLESISRCREEGDNPVAAAIRGVGEVAGAITASTLTTVAVFAPIVFVEGIAGQIFGDQAVTVVSALLVSLLVAVLFIPMLSALPMLDESKQSGEFLGWLKSAGKSLRQRPLAAPLRGLMVSWQVAKEFLFADWRWGWDQAIPSLLRLAGGLARLVGFVSLRGLALGMALAYGIFLIISYIPRRIFDFLWNLLDRAYPPLLQYSLRSPLIVLLAAAALGWFAFERAKGLGLELLPEIHQGEFTAHVALEVGTPLEVTDRVLRELAREVRSLDKVVSCALTSGVEADTLTREIEGDHTARLMTRLSATSSAAHAEKQVVQQVRALLEAHPEVTRVEITRPTPFTLDAPIAVEITGYDLDLLADVANEVRRRLEGVQGLTDVRTSIQPGHPEARLVFDRDRILEFGLDLGSISDLVRDQVQGKVSTRLVDGDDRIDIRVRGDQNMLNSVQAVKALVVNAGTAAPVPLSAVADIEIVRGPAEIRRISNSRAALVTAASTGMDLGGLGKRIEAALADMVTPPEVTVALGGQKREMDTGLRNLQQALLLAIFLVYVVMATQFESLIQPFVILFSVPLAAVGVVLALDLLSIPVSVVVLIGAILLAGIVVNNAIVLVDRINQGRAKGMDCIAAATEAGRARLRPILMTTATTVLGLLPLTGWLESVPILGLVGAGEGSELRAPMAIAVIAGLSMSTLLTLLVIPVLYSLLVRDVPGSTPNPAEKS